MRTRLSGRIAGALTLVVWLLSAPAAHAEWQVRPFIGVTFGGETTFVDAERGAGQPNVALGVSGGYLGNVLGFDGDVGFAPGFFQSGDQGLVLNSHVTTAVGNVVVALPRGLAQYTLRPYFATGAGMMHVGISHAFEVLPVSSNLFATDIGGGVTGFLTNRFGMNWDIRRFSTHSRDAATAGISIGPEDLSFWRASMALAIRL